MCVTFEVWLSMVLAMFIISLTPGAGAINTMSNSMAEGWFRAIWGIIGQLIALAVHIFVVAVGVGLLVSRSPLLFDGIRYAGAAYLVYLGVRLILANTEAQQNPDLKSMHQPQREGAFSMVRRGFFVNLLNPKAIVFYLAFLPQFININEPQLPQYAIFTGTQLVIDTIVMWFVYANVARPFSRLTQTPKGRRILNRAFGLLFIAVAVLLIFVH